MGHPSFLCPESVKPELRLLASQLIAVIPASPLYCEAGISATFSSGESGASIPASHLSA